MSARVAPQPDNTTFVDMIHPDGGTVKIPVSPRHAGGKSIEYYQKKGFKTLEQKAEEDRRQEELDSKDAEIAELKKRLRAQGKIEGGEDAGDEGPEDDDEEGGAGDEGAGEESEQKEPEKKPAAKAPKAPAKPAKAKK